MSQAAETKPRPGFQWGAYIPAWETGNNHTRHSTKSRMKHTFQVATSAPKKTRWGELMENDRKEGTIFHVMVEEASLIR